MLIVSPQMKVFASLALTDMRKGFPGLTGIVEKEMGQQIEDGDLFLFFNRGRNRLKVLFFTGDGIILLYKRLERGTFEALRAPQGDSSNTYLILDIDELRLLLDGIELSSIKRRARWRREESKKIPATFPKST